MKKQRCLNLLFVAAVIAANAVGVSAQSRCDAAGDASADNTSLPWKIRPEAKSGNWAAAMNPVIQEMQRLFPQPPKGLEVTYGIYDAMGIQTAPANAQQYYEGFFMIKDIVCVKYQGRNNIEPEGETGNWIYFRANDFKGFAKNANSDSLTLASTALPLIEAGNIRIEENKNGLKSIYFFNENDEQEFGGWYFSARTSLPYVKITNRELAASYREYWLKKFAAEITRLEGVLETSKKTYARVSAEKGVMTEAEKQKFFASLADSDRQTQIAIDRYKRQREDCIARTDRMMTGPKAAADAFVKNINTLIYEPNDLEAGGKGRFVYVANRAFYDPKLPKWQPQVITVELRRQDTSAAKTAFTKKFEDEFDFNVVRRMVGLPPMPKPPTISGMGDTPVRNTGNPAAGADQNAAGGESGVLFAEDFANAQVGQAPAKWTVSNVTGIVKKPSGQPGNWLAMSKEGLFFPDYAVLALPPNFTLEFDLSWPKGISYYSPSFYFHLGAAPYDNTLKRYDRALVNTNSYTSARMERVALWIDPYWNGEMGRYGLQVFDARGGYKLDKTDKTAIYYKDKNSVKVKLVRSGSRLAVYFNGTKMTEDAVLGESTLWNFFGFGVSSAPNAEPGDEFYVTNIRLTK
ncbi:MAG: hypothetical protein K1X36_08560 [Pyrinomonadaceae bacterium]|nr:hypothetical protein [Pyrinomonadaceae bacterium]